MKTWLALSIIVLIVLNSSVLGFTQSDLLDEKIYEAFKNESILLDSDRLEMIRDNAKVALIDNCRLASDADKNKLHFASVDIAAQLGLDAKLDASVVPRIERALNAISCSIVKTSNVTINQK